MTCAIAEAIMKDGRKDDFIDAMKSTAECIPMQAMVLGLVVG